MRTWIFISIVAITVAGATLSAAGPDAKELAQRGYSSFKDVLVGDEAKLPEAIRYMEEARKADERYVANFVQPCPSLFVRILHVRQTGIPCES